MSRGNYYLQWTSLNGKIILVHRLDPVIHFQCRIKIPRQLSQYKIYYHQSQPVISKMQHGREASTVGQYNFEGQRRKEATQPYCTSHFPVQIQASAEEGMSLD